MSVSPSAQKRIDRLQASFLAVHAEYERATYLVQPGLVEAFGTALKLLDAAICAEDGSFDPADVHHIGRLREIATARDILAHDRPSAAVEGAA